MVSVAMNIIARANEEKFMEDDSMVCDALMEIMGDKLEQRIEEKAQTKWRREYRQKREESAGNRRNQCSICYVNTTWKTRGDYESNN